MRCIAGMLAAGLFLLPLAAAAPAQPSVSHDTAYWQAVIAAGFAVPSDAPMRPLLRELSGYLASPDPELRDDIGYSVLTQWIYVQRVVAPELLRPLVADWRANLFQGIGEQGTDSVFLRSFSALMLSVAVALDNQAPWLDDAGFDRLLADALTYLRDERDTRGVDERKGWIHSVAHTADLLKFLGRSRFLESRDQAAILDAIADKLNALDHALTHGEDERLARAVVAIVARPDLDMAAFEDFLERLRPARPAGFPTSAELARNQNRKHLVVSLYALLATDSRALASLERAEDKVLALLEATI